MPAEFLPITVGELIDDQPLRVFQRVVILLCAIVLVLDGFAAQSIGFLAPSMAHSLQVPVRTFGPVFSSALVGLMLSSLLAGPMADRVGRKGPIIVATLIFGVFTIATGLTSSFHQLVLFRFLTGLGLGAAIPNVVALVTEYSPKRLRQVIVTALFCGMPLGALLGGLVSTVVLPRWGWRTVFLGGGAVPFAFALVLMVVLPESLQFLNLRGNKDRAIAAILKRLAPEMPAARLALPTGTPSVARGLSVVHLFIEGRTPGTLLLWIPFFMNLLLLYFIINWIPALLRQTHMPAIAGILAVSLFSLGGIVGSLAQGYAMQSLGGRAVMLAEFIISIALVSSLGFIASFSVMMIVMFAAGCFVQGAQAGMNALSAGFYPTGIRSTGVGWALGIGRFGSILGPMLGGAMLSRSWSLPSIFLASAMPALVAAVAILCSFGLRSERNPYSPAG